jgi:Fe-S cluster assembly protein SufD
VNSMTPPSILERPNPRSEAWKFTPVDRMAALWESDLGALSIDGPTELADGSVSTVRVTGSGTGHHSVSVPVHASAVLLVEHVGDGTCAFDLSVEVGDGATLRLVTLHDGGPDAVLQETQRITLGRDARIDGVALTVGGSLVRQVAEVTFAGPGGDLAWETLALTGAGQHHEHRQTITHDVPQCRSRVLSRTALTAPTAHTVWVGDVIIKAGATGTDTHEDNRNLVLAEGARADAVPNLEIETGEVSHAGHASATGRFDESQLFYLMSRGIPLDQARRLVVQGFLDQVLTHVPEALAAVHDRISDRISGLTGTLATDPTGAPA